MYHNTDDTRETVVADGPHDAGLGSATSIMNKSRTMGIYNMPCSGEASAVGYSS